MIGAGAGPLLEVHGLTKRYGGRTVLDGVDFELGRGECLVVLGRSGSGKSVMLRQLIGLESPDAGSIRFAGTEIVGLDENALAPVRRRVAMLFQSGALFDSMSVFDNLAFPFREHRACAADELPARVAALLDAGRFRFVGTFAEADAAADPLLADFLAGREEIDDVW